MPIDEVDLAVGQPGQDALALVAGDPVRQQLDAQRAVAEQVAVGVGTSSPAEQPPDAGGVLLGEHLGRRHQRALVAALHGGQQRASRRRPSCRRRRRPAAAGASGAGAARSASISAITRRWALGQREAQRVVEAAHQLAADLVADADGRRAPSPACASRAPAARAAARRTPAAAGPAACRRSTPGGGCRAAPRPGRSGRAGGGWRPARGRPGRAVTTRSSAFSTQPASSHVLIWAFSLCG